MAASFTPANQKRITNISIVRIKKGGKKFEIACYPNKVKAWREKLESNINEVLQVPNVFINVSKGEVAKAEDLKKSFETDDVMEVIKQILSKGELQVTEKERAQEQEGLLKDVAKIVADICINPETKRAYNPAMIEQAMRQLHLTTLRPNKTAKQQAPKIIQAIAESGKMPITRAQMTITLSVKAEFSKRVRTKVKEYAINILSDSLESQLEMEVLIEPGHLNEIEEYLNKETRGSFKLDVVKYQAVKNEVDDDAGESVNRGDSEEKLRNVPDKGQAEDSQRGAKGGKAQAAKGGAKGKEKGSKPANNSDEGDNTEDLTVGKGSKAARKPKGSRGKHQEFEVDSDDLPPPKSKPQKAVAGATSSDEETNQQSKPAKKQNKNKSKERGTGSSQLENKMKAVKLSDEDGDGSGSEEEEESKQPQKSKASGNIATKKQSNEARNRDRKNKNNAAKWQADDD